MPDFNPKRGFHEQTPEQNQHRLKLFLSEQPLRLEKIREVIQRLDSARVDEEFGELTKKFLNYPSAYRQDALRFLSNIQPIESTLPAAAKNKLSTLKSALGWQPGIEVQEFDDGRAESAKDPVTKLIRLLNERHLRFGMIGEVFENQEDKDERIMYQALHSRAHQLLRECIPSDGQIFPEKVKELAEFVEGMSNITLSMWDDEWQIIEAINHHVVVRLSSLGRYALLGDYRKIVGTSFAEAVELRKANDDFEPVGEKPRTLEKKRESPDDVFNKFLLLTHEKPLRPEVLKKFFEKTPVEVLVAGMQKKIDAARALGHSSSLLSLTERLLPICDQIPEPVRRMIQVEYKRANDAWHRWYEARPKPDPKPEPVPEVKIEARQQNVDQQKTRLMGQLRGGSFAYANRLVVDRYGADGYKDAELRAAAKDGLIRLKAEGSVSPELIAVFAKRWGVDESEFKKPTKKRTKK